MTTKVFYGSELKLNINIKPISDYTMDDYDFEVNVCNKVIITKEEAIRVDEDNYVICLDTKKLGLGAIRCTVTAYIPDEDFGDDGHRTEVVSVDTGITVVKTF